MAGEANILIADEVERLRRRMENGVIFGERIDTADAEIVAAYWLGRIDAWREQYNEAFVGVGVTVPLKRWFPNERT